MKMIAHPMKILKLMPLHFRMQHLINEPSHILPALSSCIDLVFVFIFASKVPSSDNTKINLKWTGNSAL